MSKEELLKYLIAEIDLIMHDKDYRFENANGTWYSRESCRDLTNEEVFEELRTELRQFADLEAKLAEKDEEIAYLTKQVKKFNNEAQKYFEDAYCNDFHNQDKISFAVEVLKIAQDYVQQYVNNFDDMNDCLCAIDNQINQLTHQREDKGECNV